MVTLAKVADIATGTQRAGSNSSAAEGLRERGAIAAAAAATARSGSVYRRVAYLGRCARREGRPLSRLGASTSPPSGASNGSTSEYSLESEIKLEDSLPEKALLILFAHKMAEQVQGVRVPLNPSFAEVVEVSREIYKGRSSAEVQQLVAKALDGILPPHADLMLRIVWPVAQWSAELDAEITKTGFRWLVGPMEIQTAEVDFEGKKQLWNSQVKIKRCRYLEAAGCVGMCTNLCKMPTQDFFSRIFGMPLAMEPNFDDFSCTATFGRPPPPLEEDPCYNQPCYHTCSMQRNRPDTHPVGGPPPETDRGPAC